ncbi:P-loop containing nucleoside triphosphate hydrolase protein [Dothidotthia symphoricarpi CBS 119687]|uniref:P-loop containing nucleoside triphosphate hydrolase protein n=1 Tax=Dothidotthia symphoricarpi CBS 119687 TaxID=1392245 RepID=A0A6A6A9K6_9PLEO|nr:P-loop containing nucleoside triphosphate hydrolase protein [Dothidotthia symphoricarpi CBS 119687]KAF2128236.1 P-loop containing nucleoside triphosphate hydrolase protein [Dothidotthia symphoricarpi CBS 119687]
MAPKKPCFNFKRGSCHYGAKCHYSHDTKTTHASSSSTTDTKPVKETEIEETCRKWIYMIPKANMTSRFQAVVNIEKFFQIGWNIIESEDAGTRQRVITKLGEETGLAIIKTLTDGMDTNQRDETTISIFRDKALPFYRIISHPDVLHSLVLETPVDAIYTFLFGPSGRRGLRVFQFTATALSGMISGHSSGDEELFTIAVTSSLAVLDRLVEINQSAHVIEGFVTIVETISACIPENFAVPNAQQSLTRIRRRLNIGTSLPFAPAQSVAQSLPAAAFELSQDPPGDLSSNGVRHDNDHASIASIQILPTAQEIASLRQEYLPLLDSTQHHLSGLAGLLDRQFRLLREDTVGQLRDAVREEIVRLSHPNRKTPTHQGQQGVRRLIYHNVRFARMSVDRRKGLQVVAEFDQPPQLNKKSMRQREEWWNASKLLQLDSLVCFVSSNGKIIFLSVCDSIASHGRRDSMMDEKKVTDDGPSLFKHPSRASVLLSLAKYEPEDVVWIGNHIAPSKSQQSLVEFPGVLLPSFEPTLQALQKMSGKLSLPFADIIAPESHTQAVVTKPPAYTTKRGFSFNLDVLSGAPLTLTPGQAFDFGKLEEGSTLDEAQQFAVVQALSTGLALIQGPPGTGKSYTGVAIIKALLRNRKAADLGPIICVCYTNHALDQLLEHVVEDGVRQVVRLGSRSKSELLKNLTLSRVAEGAEPTKTEKHDKWEHSKDIRATLLEIEELLSGLNSPNSWTNIQAHLMNTHNRHFKELFGKGVDEEGFQEVKGKKFRVVESWLRGAPKKLTSNRPVAELTAISLKEMSASERGALHRHWIEQRSMKLTNDLVHALDSYQGSKSALDNCHRELDLRCLREAHIIGVTTSGLARNIELLQRVRAKVMICEEAGEVLEAHTLTAFLPGVEHAILIGDHEQLRPQINNYELQHDNTRGKRYSLDISLFERLVKPQTGNPQVPLSTLKIQRRMHPSISDLIRAPLYPDLQDHASVSEYPEVDGMRDRLYWLDHQEKEDAQPTQAVSLSKTNTFEVEMTATLVSHLVRQGTYGSGDIAVITPYLGQLQKIRKRLANSFEIVVGDRDQEELDTQGLQDDTGASTDGSGKVRVQKTTLLNALRVATVDNFQGEEAKVIIVSLVRSNEQRKCGFLKTSNRINVLLSRARHGMYIIGNSDTSRPVPMWAGVLSMLERSNNIGPSLALCCPRHKDTPINVSVPDDFARLAPEGGCSKRCLSGLNCGHACPNMCHSESLHNAVRCLKRCPRTKKGCEHECPRPCGDACESKCQVVLFDIPLPCGHIARQLPCHLAQNPDEVRCQVKMEQVMPHCKHKIRVKCHELPLTVDHPCSATCGAALDCGHNCTRACKDCNTRTDGMIVETKHGVCNTPCGRPYSTCSHSCKARCHGDKPCTLCKQPCEVSCNHSRCSKLCNEPCAPCAEDCSWSCPHRGRCPLPCAVPCDLLPCSKRCSMLLACGHQCPSICGEFCPGVAFCQICAPPTIKGMVVDFIMSSTFEDIDLDEEPCIVPPCGHIITLESMDGHMSMSDFYTQDSEGSIVGLKHSAEPFSASEMKKCPTCRGPLRNLNRYSRIVRRALIDEATKKFIVWANTEFVPLVTRMQAVETQFREDPTDDQRKFDKVSLEFSLPGPLQLKGSRENQISQISTLTRQDDRYKTITKLRRDVKRFLQQVDEKEQPFGRIYDLVQDARRHRKLDIDLHSKVDILQVRNRLLATVLLIRCDYTILLAFLTDRKGEANLTIQVDLSMNRKDCEALIAESQSRIQPGNYVEGLLYWARFFALERNLAEPGTELTELLEKAREYLRHAHLLCDQYPGQTIGMRSEVEEVEKMLRDSTFYMPVSNEEKAAVYAAMARDFRGTGHWYYCENGHPFTVGECGMPMETSQCPQCGSPVGGQNHRSVGGVRSATDLEHQFGGLGI